MNGLDIALLVILFFFFLRGIFRGFIKEITGIIGLVGGFMLASSYYPVMADQLKPFIQNLAYRQAIGFEIIFLVAFFLISLIGLLLDKLIKLSVSAVANGLMGAVIGLIKGIVLAAVVLMATTAFIRPNTPFFKDSITWPYMKAVTESLKEMVPPELKESLEQKAELLTDAVKPKLPDITGGDDQEAPWKKVSPESGDETPPPAWPDSTQ